MALDVLEALRRAAEDEPDEETFDVLNEAADEIERLRAAARTIVVLVGDAFRDWSPSAEAEYLAAAALLQEGEQT